MWVGRVDIVHNAAQKGPSPPPEQALGAIAWGADVPLGRGIGRELPAVGGRLDCCWEVQRFSRYSAPKRLYQSPVASADSRFTPLGTWARL
jgi:hypothetical protein